MTASSHVPGYLLQVSNPGAFAPGDELVIDAHADLGGKQRYTVISVESACSVRIVRSTWWRRLLWRIRLAPGRLRGRFLDWWYSEDRWWSRWVD